MKAGLFVAVLASLAGGKAVAAGQAIPFKRDAEASAIAGSGSIAVLLVSLLAIGAVYVVRKRLKLGPRMDGSPALLRVLETRRLGPRALLAVVEFGGKRHLIAQGEHGVSCIDTIVLASAAAKPEAGDAH